MEKKVTGIMTLVIFMTSLFPFYSFAQEDESSIIDQANALSKVILSRVDDSTKATANEQLVHLIHQSLLNHELPIKEYINLEHISSLFNKDTSIVVLSWIVPNDNGTFEYFGLIKNQIIKPFQTTLLNDASMIEDDYTSIYLSQDDWYGALYYKLIEVETDSSKQYTLLGWKGNDRITTKKVIDVLHFTETGEPKFGAPVFQKEDSVQYREIFEFSAEVSMSITYDSLQQVIIMDHLFPSNPSLKGHYEFYGPDLSFDAFKMEGGHWMYIEDYDPGNRPDKKEFQLRDSKIKYDP